MKKILFYPCNEDVASQIDPPTPSSKYNIPDWFRKLPKYANNEKQFFFRNGVPNLTVKSCLPVVDGLTAGYTLNTHCDLQVTRENGDVIFTWAFSDKSITQPVISRGDANNEQKCPWINMEGYDDLQFNWAPVWNIRTPKGYSCLFTHPINRVDLPFYTLGGILDTDGWGDAGNQPFLLKKGWTGIIPKNTPIVQVIPFKRESWESHSDKTMTQEYRKQINKRDSFLKDYYKKFIWSPKTFK